MEGGQHIDNMGCRFVQGEQAVAVGQLGGQVVACFLHAVGKCLGKLDVSRVVEGHQRLERGIRGNSLRQADIPRRSIEGEEGRIAGGALVVGVDGAPIAIFSFRSLPLGAAVNRIPNAFRLRWVDGGSAHLLRKQTGDNQCLIAHHFGGQTVAGPASKQAVARVLLDQRWSRFVRLAVGRGEHQLLEEWLEVPCMIVAQTQCEEIEKLGVEWKRSRAAEVAEGFDDAGSKELGPKTVGQSPCSEGVLVADQPLRHVEAVGRF